MNMFHQNGFMQISHVWGSKNCKREDAKTNLKFIIITKSLLNIIKFNKQKKSTQVFLRSFVEIINIW